MRIRLKGDNVLHIVASEQEMAPSPSPRRRYVLNIERVVGMNQLKRMTTHRDVRRVLRGISHRH